MITIDGSFGEGGGQILRTSLGLSLVTGKSFRIERIRAGRKKPGLMRQHLTAVQSAAEIGRAEVEGDALGSQFLTFMPREPRPGKYRFSVGTAGSTTLVLQTLLPALLLAREPSTLILEGGTHNPFAPPFHFLEKTFLPLINRMNPKVTAVLKRPGFFPAGGGEIHIRVEPSERLSAIHVLERTEIRRRFARALVAKLPLHIARRELRVVKEKMNLREEELAAEEVKDSRGPGNVLFIEIESENLTEVFTGFGQRGVRAESVALDAVNAAQKYLARPAPVGEHLSDQLLIPLALAGGGSFKTLSLTLHARTNIDVMKEFLDVKVSVREAGDQQWLVEIGSPAL